MPTTSHILMIRPVRFGYNAETAVNNTFQVKNKEENVQQKALKEFDDFVYLLKKSGIDVTVIEDTPEPHTPDSIFPNNWLSFHHDGTMLLYPMYAVNRRFERKDHVIELISKKFTIKNKIDLTGYEKQNVFLEGTGSMVLDRDNHITYACLSPRTSKEVLAEFCNKMNYQPVLFSANDSKGQAIYHTNVMMCVADKYVVICLDSITDKKEKETMISVVTKSEKEIVDITLEQMNHFAGNMLQLENKDGEELLVMSSQAYSSLTDAQKNKFLSHNQIIHSSLNTIETNGGGSARCMMAEVHLPLL